MISNLERKTLRDLLKITASHSADTRPNPAVAAALIVDDQVIGIDRHHGPGTPHAEAALLSRLGEKANGGTLIVTLEPCSHWGANPPCTNQVINSGIRRVIYPISDPNPLVKTHPGGALLSEAGIEVVSNVFQSDAAIANAEFLTHISQHRPFVTGKVAISVDGKISSTGSSDRYISGKSALRFVHELRDHCDGILVGIGTVLADNPRLDARSPDTRHFRQPKKVILDPFAQTPIDSLLFRNTSPENVIICTLSSAPQAAISALLSHATIRQFQGKSLRTQWKEILSELYQLSIFHLLIEGGESVMSTAIDAGIVDRIITIQSPIIIGDGGGRTMYSLRHGSTQSPLPILYPHYRRLGRDMVTSGYLNDPVHLVGE